MQGAFDLLIGLAGSVGVGVLLWVVARRARSAPQGSFWSGDGAASALSLVLVAGLVIVLAWSVKGAMEIFPEPILGALVGIAASLVAVFVPLKMFGKLPV